MVDLSIASYNCKHLDKVLCKIDFMKNVLNTCEFLCLQEHWLYDTQYQRFDLLSDCSVDFTATSAMDSNVIRAGRPHGGTAIIWKSNLNLKVEIVSTVSNRLSAVKIYLKDDTSVILFNVYMPTDQRVDGVNLVTYQDVLAEISLICRTHDVNNIIICGDFNTDLGRETPQTVELRLFCEAENLFPCVHSDVCSVKYTYESPCGARSLIDHCIVSDNLSKFVRKMYTHDSVDNSSDHTAIVCEFSIQVDYIEVNVSKNIKHCTWYKATLTNIEQYKIAVDRLLDKVHVPHEALECRDVQCKSHKADLEEFHYALIKSVCLCAGEEVLPPGGKHNSHRPVPGWKEYVSDKKEHALNCHWLWKEAGSPNSGPLFDNRKQSRAEYHHAVKIVKKNEDRVRSECMAKSLANNEHKKLWKEVNKVKGRKKALPAVVDGVKGDAKIAGIFANKYKQLYSSVAYDSERLEKVFDNVSGRLASYTHQDVQVCLIKVDELKSAIKQLSCGKSDGQTGLFSDHIVHGTPNLYRLITALFNAMIVHGVSPSEMLSSVMLPIVKNKRVQSSNSDNFRAVCLQSVLCKLLDLIVLAREKHALITSELQFGFKAKHSTALATAVLMQTVDYYIDNGGHVYGLALDASKAFDRVEYSRLFELLIDRGMNPLYTRLILDMYVNQQMCVRYSSSISEWFCPSNGVKQGGVLSPTLFAVYIDGMLRQLEISNIGCCVGNKYCGVISYADDVILLSPSQRAMSSMINICKRYADEYLIKFNGKKCQSIIFTKGNNEFQPKFYVDDQEIVCVKEMIYLGYSIKGDRSDPNVLPIVCDFNRKVNAFLGDLGCLSSEVKASLFQQYCTSLYGILFSQLYHAEADKLNVNWRKAMRRLYKLPQKTHCKLLPIVTDLLPVDIQVDLRYLKFMKTGITHENSVIKFMFNLCIGLCNSVMAKNFKFICKKQDISIRHVINSSHRNVRKCIEQAFYQNMSEQDKSVGTQIKELVVIRDLMYSDFNLNRSEICDIIEHLATR